MGAETDNRRIISYKRFNPNFHHLRLALGNDDIRFIFMYGGSSSAKSFSAAQAFLLECISKGYNTIVFRKTGATIADSIYKTFQEAAKSLHIDTFFKFQENLIRCFNGSYIRFKGLDDPEKIKGLESYQYVFCEEISEFDESDLKQIRKRLRGRKGQKIVALFNPISEDHWIKKKIFDTETLTEVDNHLYGKLKDSVTGKILPKEYSEVGRKWVNSERTIYNPRKKTYETHRPDMVIIKSTYLNNFWVVGSPDGTYGFYDAQTIADFERDKERDYAYYLIYALGEWGTIRTGGEFFHAFDPAKHKGKCPYVKAPVHISIDNNVLPYISISFWQVETGDITRIRQIHEETPSDPFNTVTKAAEIAVEYLEGIGHDDMVYLYGDVSTKAGNTIDDDKRSFFDKFKEGIDKRFRSEDRLPRSNPSVSMTGEFINAIYSGDIKDVSIMIDESCETSVNDYITVKKDVNGAMLKQRVKDKITGQSYEKAGHLSDTKRYFVTEILKDRYTSFSLRRRHNKNKEEDMRYYDHVKLDISNAMRMVYVAVNPDGLAGMAKVALMNGKAYVLDASLRDITEAGVLKDFLRPIGWGDVVFESDKAYFPVARDIRESGECDIRIRKRASDARLRISAHSETVRDRFYFLDNYEEKDDYLSFVENMLDYGGKDGGESLCCLSAIAEILVRNNI